MALLKSIVIAQLLFIVTVHTAPAGQIDMDDGRNAADVKFLLDNCADWIAFDQERLLSFGEKIRDMPMGPKANDWAWAYKVQSSINGKFLKNRSADKIKFYCEMTAKSLSDNLGAAAPVWLKNQ